MTILKYLCWYCYILLPQVHPAAKVVHKGINPSIDSYSAFFDNAKLGKTSLEEIIREGEVTDVYVCGIATDVCVGEYCQTPVSGLGQGIDFTLALDNNNNNNTNNNSDNKNPHLNFLKWNSTGING